MWDVSHARSGRAADLIDYCIHRYCDGTHCSDSKLNPRWVCLLAIGECLRGQYDAVASPTPASGCISSSASKRRSRGARKPLRRITPPFGECSSLLKRGAAQHRDW
jgi:hypothetical protein